jgi:putative ATP-binding cassette transporter
MNLVGFLLRSSWITLLVAIVMGSVSGACSTLLLAQINNELSSGNPSSDLLWGFIGLAVITLLTSVLSQYLLVKLSQSAVYQLRLRLSHWILSCPLRHLETLGANRLLAALTEDINSISDAVLIIPFLCIDFALIAGCLVYLCWLSLPVFLITSVLIAVAVIAIQVLASKTYHLFEVAREEEDRLFKHFRAITDGIKELKLHRNRRTAFLTEELQVSAAASRQANVTSMAIAAFAYGNAQLLFFIILGLLVFALPQFMSIQTNVLSGYVVTITYLMVPFTSIVETLPGIGRASVALKKIDTLGLSLASRSETTARISDRALPFREKIEFREVIHTYYRENDDGSFTLGPLDLSIERGKLLFIIGGNGSGKSTLGKIIAGLYLPENGKILLDGEVINNQNREAYRQLFAAVFSDFYLFDRLLGIESDRLDLLAQEYLEKLQLDHKLKVTNGILSTIELSQGQRKRLALLTAYLDNRSIYLFDEWAADQDPYFREIFYQQILPELKNRGKTVIVISHDDRYFHLADRVIKLDCGKLA